MAKPFRKAVMLANSWAELPEQLRRWIEPEERARQVRGATPFMVPGNKHRVAWLRLLDLRQQRTNGAG